MLKVDKSILLSYYVIVLIFVGCYWFIKWFSTVTMCFSAKCSKEFLVYCASNNIKGTGISKVSQSKLNLKGRFRIKGYSLWHANQKYSKVSFDVLFIQFLSALFINFKCFYTKIGGGFINLPSYSWNVWTEPKTTTSLRPLPKLGLGLSWIVLRVCLF